MPTFYKPGSSADLRQRVALLALMGFLCLCMGLAVPGVSMVVDTWPPPNRLVIWMVFWLPPSVAFLAWGFVTYRRERVVRLIERMER